MVGVQINPEPGSIAWRHVNALSWRVLSELARRDNSLYIALTGDGGSAAFAMALIITDGRSRDYQARRRGSGFTAGSGGGFQIEWREAFERPSPREIARQLECSRGLDFPRKSPVTLPRALGYRVIATLLELTVGDSARWDAIEFPSKPFQNHSADLRPWEDAAWMLTCDDETVASIDNFGNLRRRGQEEPLSLMHLYVRHDRRIVPLVADLFGAKLK
jgi:hypothetical protein